MERHNSNRGVRDGLPGYSMNSAVCINTISRSNARPIRDRGVRTTRVEEEKINHKKVVKTKKKILERGLGEVRKKNSCDLMPFQKSPF